ncbi:MAG: hypothetical protein AAGF97_01330 [Planctomycetota bacterium]
MVLTIFLSVIAFIVIAMMWGEGMWGNAITLMNTVFAVMVAFNTYEYLANWLAETLPSFTYFSDYLAVWLIFAAVFNILRLTTDQVSKHRVRFKMPIEHTGRALFAVATAWVMVCFVCATLHMAPLARTSFRGGFGAEPLSKHFVGLAPDRMFLGFMHSRSSGALATSPPNVFDPNGEFILKYGARRQMLKEHNARVGTPRVVKK